MANLRRHILCSTAIRILLLLLFAVAVSNTIIVRHYFRCVVTIEKITSAQTRRKGRTMSDVTRSSILSSTYGNDSKHYNTVATVESGFPKMAYYHVPVGRGGNGRTFALGNDIIG